MRGMAVFMACALAACRFDAAGAGEGGGTPDGAIDQPDGEVITPGIDAMPPPPDARINQPDAMPPPPPADVIHAMHSSATFVTVDGNLGEWAGTTWTTFGAADAGRHLHVKAPAWAVDTGVKMAARWTPTTLYLAFEIVDDSLVIDSTELWNDDSIEFYVDPEGDGGAYGLNDHWVVLAPDDMCRSYDSGLLVGVVCSANQGGPGWTVEAAIPMADLAITATAGATFGFGAGVNDDDGLTSNGATFDGYATWTFAPTTCTDCCGAAAHTDPWCDQSRLGTMILDP